MLEITTGLERSTTIVSTPRIWAYSAIDDLIFIGGSTFVVAEIV
jgi:hypothetical protein